MGSLLQQDKMFGKLGRGSIARITPDRVVLRRRPKEVPRALWSRVVDDVSWPSALAKLGAYAAGAGLALMVFPASVELVGGGTFPIGWTLTAIGLVLFGAASFYFAIGVISSRLMAALLESDYRLCLECGYNLVGAEPKAVCPECGAAFDAEAAREAWLEAIPDLRV